MITWQIIGYNENGEQRVFHCTTKREAEKMAKEHFSCNQYHLDTTPKKIKIIDRESLAREMNHVAYITGC